MSVIDLPRELVTRPLAKKKTKSKYAGDFGTLFTVGYELGEVERTLSGEQFDRISENPRGMLIF